MGWRDSLLPASFRGVPFKVEQSSMPVGRRGQLHEFPQRDDAQFEALGKQAQTHKLTAWLSGSDCFEVRDKLVEALGAEGSGELVHPWLGRMIVEVGECSMTHERLEGGVVRFEMEFHPEKPRQYPSATVNTRQKASQASEGLLASALGRYSAAMAKVDGARINVLAMRNSLSGVYSVIERQFSPIASAYTNAGALVSSIANTPGALSAQISGFLSTFTPSSSDYRTAVATATQQVESAASITTVSMASGQDTGAAGQAVANLLQDALFVQVAKVVADMPVAYKAESIVSTPSLDQQQVSPIDRPEVPVSDDVLQLRDALSDVIWQAALKADLDHYRALSDLRQAVSKHLSAVAASGVRLVDVTPNEVLPALVLAYRRFGDATRSGEVVQRNRIQHPGFIAPLTLKIAQE